MESNQRTASAVTHDKGAWKVEINDFYALRAGDCAQTTRMRRLSEYDSKDAILSRLQSK